VVRNLYLRNGIYVFRKEINGKKYKRSTGFRDRRAAERRAAEIEVEVRNGQAGWTAAPPLSFQQWVQTYERSYGRRKRSERRDAQILAHVLPGWGRRPMNGITRSDCVAYVNRREDEGAKPGTITREVGLLKAIFNAAIQDGLLVSNPWAGIRRPRSEPRARVLTHGEQAALLAVLNLEYRRLVVVALGTGLREAELLGLRPQDVDTAAAFIRVRAETAKGGKSRTVPLVRAVEDAIDQQATFNACGAGDRLWRQTPSAVWKCISSAAGRANIPPLCVHDFRRTFATRCAVAGMAPAQLQKVLGHQSPQMTMRYYVHIQEADLRRALDKVDLGLTAASGPKVVPLERRSA
jgi:integrase